MLHAEDKIMTELGEMVPTLLEHSWKVAQGGSLDWAAVNDYLRETTKPRKWKRLPKPVLPMTTEVMQEAIKRSTARDCS